MKKRIASIAALANLLAWPGLAPAQSPAATAGGGKIGLINMQNAIAATAEGKKALAELQAKYQPRQQELARQQQEIQNLQEQLQKQATTLSDEEQVRRRRDLEEKNKLFTRASDDYTASVREDRQDFINRIGQKMMKIIEDYAPQNGYALVVDAQVPVVTSDQVFDGQIQVWYASKEVNISDEIVKRYDSAYPTSAASKPALSNPAPPPTRPSGAAVAPGPGPNTNARPSSPPKTTDKPKS